MFVPESTLPNKTEHTSWIWSGPAEHRHPISSQECMPPASCGYPPETGVPTPTDHRCCDSRTPATHLPHDLQQNAFQMLAAKHTRCHEPIHEVARSGLKHPIPDGGPAGRWWAHNMATLHHQGFASELSAQNLVRRLPETCPSTPVLQCRKSPVSFCLK